MARILRSKSDKSNPRKPKPKPKNWLHGLWLNWIKPIGLAVLIVFGFRWTFIDWNDVPSGSMEPTILVGDRIFVNKLAYHFKLPFLPWRIVTWADPERGDIVVFKSPEDGTRMVKRVIGLPGDTIELRDNVLFINGVQIENLAANQGKYSRLDLDPVRDRSGRDVPAEFALEKLGDIIHPVMYLQRGNGGWDWDEFGPATIPDGMYMMIGDNRNNSRDSRKPIMDVPSEGGLGFVPRDRIVGRAFGIAFSIDKKPSFRFRWDRFFRGFDQETVEQD